MRCSSWPQLLALYRRDIANGKLFLRAKKAPPPGTVLRVQLLLPSGNKIQMTGTIRAVLGADSPQGAGAVVALDPLAPAHRMTLDAALAALAEKTRRETARGVKPTRPDKSASDPLSFDDGRELDSAEDELLDALRSELATLAKLNPFQILGVGYSADDETIRGAFGDLSRRYHPDRFVRYQSEAIGQLAEELFVRARDAYKQTATASSRALLVEQIRAERKPRKPPPPDLLTLASRGRQLGPTRPQAPSADLLAHQPTETAARAATTKKTSTLLATATAAATETPATRYLGSPKLTPASRPKPPPRPAPPIKAEPDPLLAYPNARGMLDEKRFTEADGLFGLAARRDQSSDAAKAGVELAAALRALEQGDRLEAAQRFEAVLDLHPANEVAARELANMRRRATDQRKGLLAKLMKDNG